MDISAFTFSPWYCLWGGRRKWLQICLWTLRNLFEETNCPQSIHLKLVLQYYNVFYDVQTTVMVPSFLNKFEDPQSGKISRTKKEGFKVSPTSKLPSHWWVTALCQHPHWLSWVLCMESSRFNTLSSQTCFYNDTYLPFVLFYAIRQWD